MNARKYRVQFELSKLDFPAISGLGNQSDFTQMEIPIVKEHKVVLQITKKLILRETITAKDHEILTAQSVYEIPTTSIRKSEDIYSFFEDATLGLSEAYTFVKSKMPLPDFKFPTPSIETFEREINGVFQVITAQN